MGRLHKSGALLSLAKRADNFCILWYTVENMGRRQAYELY